MVQVAAWFVPHADAHETRGVILVREHEEVLEQNRKGLELALELALELVRERVQLARPERRDAAQAHVP